MATYTNQSKNTSIYTNIQFSATNFILKEDSGFLLKEDGFKFILEFGDENISYTNKSKNISVYTNITKS